MTMSSKAPLVLLLIAMSLAFVACDSPKQSPTPQAKAQPSNVKNVKPGSKQVVQKKPTKPKVVKKTQKATKKPKFAYSPFVLQVKSDSVFKSMSFKDVGAHLGDKNASMIYETLAESLSMEVSSAQSLGMYAQVTYDKSNLDPANHLACGSDRIYIDFWKSQKPAKWGYSLWSGCGEDDNFAWKELPYTPSKSKDITRDITPLAKSIVASIQEAQSKNCFQKSC